MIYNIIFSTKSINCLWQTIENKAHGIEQFRKGDRIKRLEAEPAKYDQAISDFREEIELAMPTQPSYERQGEYYAARPTGRRRKIM